MFGSRPEKNDPEIDKLNFWFTLIGPLRLRLQVGRLLKMSTFYKLHSVNEEG